MTINPHSDAKEIALRLELMQELIQSNTTAINEFTHMPKQWRSFGQKRDGTTITELDYKIDWNTYCRYQKSFPQDGFDGEEVHFIRPAAKYCLLQDPIDSTNHALNYNAEIPNENLWPTCMMSLLEFGEPVAFAFGVPLRKQIYWGCKQQGVFLNSEKIIIHQSPSPISIGLGHRNTGEILALTGSKEVKIAGQCTWLILQGITSCGICPFHLPHESSCIAAAALCAGAHISNIFGRPFQPYNEMSRLIWAFPPMTINGVMNMHNQTN